MTTPRIRLAASAAGVAAIALLAGTAGAQTLIPSATISVGGGYSTNPFLQSQNAKGEASVQLNVNPSLQIIDDTDSAVISANYNRTDYLSNYGSNDGYGVSINANSALNARTSIYLAANFDSQILGAGGAYSYSPVIAPVDTGTGTGTDTTGTGTIGTGVVVNPVVDVGVGNDIGLIGLRQRRNSLSASFGGSYRPDEVSSWGLGASLSRSSYPDNGGIASNFRSYGVNASYTRSLNERSSIGLQVSATTVDYAIAPNSKFVTPRVTYSTMVRERWSLNLAVGASFVDDGFSTGVAASATASLCKSGELDNICFNASREPSVSGFGGARTNSSIGASYSRRLAERTNMAASASYQHSGSGVTTTSLGESSIDGQDYLNGSLSINQGIGRRISAYGSLNYRDVKGLGVPIDADIGGRIGLTLSLGGRS